MIFQSSEVGKAGKDGFLVALEQGEESVTLVEACAGVERLTVAMDEWAKLGCRDCAGKLDCLGEEEHVRCIVTNDTILFATLPECSLFIIFNIGVIIYLL